VGFLKRGVVGRQSYNVKGSLEGETALKEATSLGRKARDTRALKSMKKSWSRTKPSSGTIFLTIKIGKNFIAGILGLMNLKRLFKKQIAPP